MSRFRPMSRRRIALIWIFTCTVATGMGCMLGLLASAWYTMEGADGLGETLSRAGWLSGGASGLAAAGVWCYVTLALYHRAPMRFRIGLGMYTGIVAGLLSAAAVHLTLIAISDLVNRYCLHQGIAFGVAAGAALGAFSAALFRVPDAIEETP